MLDTVKNAPVNGLDLAALGEVVEEIEKDASKAIVGFDVVTRWKGQTRSETTVDGFTLAGERISRSHTIVADEPFELLGADSAPNPQELLMAAFNACITVGYVAGASLKGIKLESLEIKTRGELDLRGFLGISDAVAPGLRERRLCRDHQGRRFARGFRGNPPDGHEDVAQLLQHEPSDQNERIASRRLTQHSAPRGRAWRRTAHKRGAKKNMADLGIQKINPNKALWEKGDFTRIAETMRESGEELVATLGIEPGHVRARRRLRRRDDGASCREARRQRPRRRHRLEPRGRRQRPREGGGSHQPAL